MDSFQKSLTCPTIIQKFENFRRAENKICWNNFRVRLRSRRAGEEENRPDKILFQDREDHSICIIIPIWSTHYVMDDGKIEIEISSHGEIKSIIDDPDQGVLLITIGKSIVGSKSIWNLLKKSNFMNVTSALHSIDFKWYRRSKRVSEQCALAYRARSTRKKSKWDFGGVCPECIRNSEAREQTNQSTEKTEI